MEQTDIIIPKSTQYNRLLKSLFSLQGNSGTKSSEGYYLNCNQHMLNFIGKTSSQEIQGATDADFSWNDRTEIYRAHDQQVEKNNKSYFFIEPALNSKNQVINLLAIKAPLSELMGITGTVGFSIAFDQGAFNKNLLQYLQAAEILKLKLEPRLMIRIITQVMQLNHAYSQWKHDRNLFDYGTVKFTLREAQCLHFFLNNYSAEKTSKELYISRKTVECHLARIKNKLKCKDKTQITNIAIDNGFIDLMFMRF